MDAKRKLKNLNVTAIAVTDPSQGGACSLLNEPLLLKSLKEDATLSEHQKELLISVGHEESDINKMLVSGKNTPSKSSSEETGEDKVTKDKGTDNNMSDQENVALALVQKELGAMKIEKSLRKYGFSDEVSESVSAAMANLDEDGRSEVIKGFDALVESKEEALTKAKEAETVAVNKALGKEGEELGESLTKELGDAGDETSPETLTPIEKALKIQAEQAEKGSK